MFPQDLACSILVEKHSHEISRIGNSSLPHVSHPSTPLLSTNLHPSCSTIHIFPEKGLFILQSEPLNRCITVDRSNPVLNDCERPTRRMLWKWVSRHRLFNVGTSKCLGLNISDTTQPLGMFECDMTVPVLWWRCKGYMLYGASQWRVAVTGRSVVVKHGSYTEWKRYNTLKETACSYPYEGKCLKYHMCLLIYNLNNLFGEI